MNKIKRITLQLVLALSILLLLADIDNAIDATDSDWLRFLVIKAVSIILIITTTSALSRADKEEDNEL